jgi:hypothetical protein
MKATGMEDNSEAKPLAQIERHSYSEVGWISRQNLLALRSRENFFLTSLFIELIDPWQLDDLNSAVAANHTDFSVLRQETSESNISE